MAVKNRFEFGSGAPTALTANQIFSQISIQNPFSQPQLWDQIWIGNVPSPGICLVGDFKRSYEWDVKKGKGSQSSTLTYTGRKPAKGQIKFLLFAAEHFAQWSAFIKLLQYDPTKKKINAIDIGHPSINFVGIHSVVTENIGNVIHEGKQLYSITVSFIEYFPPSNANAVSTPKKSDTDAVLPLAGSLPLSGGFSSEVLSSQGNQSAAVTSNTRLAASSERLTSNVVRSKTDG